MAVSRTTPSPVAAQAFWAILSWFAGLAVAQADTTPTIWLTERALLCLSAYTGLGLLILLAKAIRRRTFR